MGVVSFFETESCSQDQVVFGSPYLLQEASKNRETILMNCTLV